MRQADRMRFEARFVKTEGCWLWQGGPNTQGYGQFQLDGKNRMTHRVSFQLYRGEIPEGLIVRHKCDNRICVNPDHLEVGTQQENILDAVNRNRMAVGELNGRAVITAKLVVEIRDLLRCGLFSQQVIAGFYGINRSLVGNINIRRTWTSVP